MHTENANEKEEIKVLKNCYVQLKISVCISDTKF